MKNLLLVIALVALFNFNTNGQTSKDIPANVKTTFSKQFPKATNVKWDKENNNEWEAEFKMNGKEYSANFDNNGKWMETEYEIAAKEIPITVKTTLDIEFKAYKIEEAAISETKSGKLYEFDLKKDGKKTEVAIDVNGKVVKKEQTKMVKK